MHRELFQRLRYSRDFLAAHFADPWSLADAARLACLSPFHFHRVFAQAFGETPIVFLTRVRMYHARQLLIDTEIPVTHVCQAVGYASLGTFSSRFRREAGCSPTEYRRSGRRSFPGYRVRPSRFIPMCFLVPVQVKRKIEEDRPANDVLFLHR